MDILRKLRNPHKPNAENVGQDQPVAEPEAAKNGNAGVLSKSVSVDSINNVEVEDDDDDFITNEVKRRLKELRRNSFMVLIPEETAPAEEEDDEEEGGETSSSEWRDVEAEGRQFWSGFDAVYDMYCERMLLFDRSSAQLLLEAGSGILSSPSPKSAKKLTSPFRCISLRKFDAAEEEVQQLHQPVSDAYNDIESAYVSQLCLTWEALHAQYTQLTQKILCQPETPVSYNHSAQQFQQFQVLLQRFIENEPFEPGARPEIYARARKSWSKLLQVPKIQAFEEKGTGGSGGGGEEAPDLTVTATDLIRIIETSILSFRQFVKTDKAKSGATRSTTSVQQLQSSLEKKSVKLKELWKRSKNFNKKRSWPTTREDAETLLALVDVKVVRRVARMLRISKEQFFWCEEKMKKLGFAEGKLQRDPSPILFPC